MPHKQEAMQMQSPSDSDTPSMRNCRPNSTHGLESNTLHSSGFPLQMRITAEGVRETRDGVGPSQRASRNSDGRKRGEE